MSDPTRDPLRGVALYNPHLLSKEELKRDFVARRKQLESLTGDLRSRIGASPQHHLILGQRGMGKSTLLRRIAYEIQDDPELALAYVPLLFPEEQYNVKHLGDLWLNCLDALSDALEAEGRKEESDALDAAVERIPVTPPERTEDLARTLLLNEAKRLGRRLVLLLDNVDLVFDRIKQADWVFREVLQRSDALVLVGASASALESTHDYGEAFYDFFRIVRLGGLDDQEARELLLALADRQSNSEVRRIVEETPERVATIRTLAGGNPRTMATLYDILAASAEGDVRGDLELLLDRHTPLYKARFEALADQAQQVVDAVCILWDPVLASDVAKHVGLEVNKVSSQLDRLVTDGIVEKVPAVDRKTGKRLKKQAFQIVERFFNIWYLMRASRRVRRKLLWLVRFLEAFYGRKGISREASRVLETLGSGKASDHEIELALTLVDRIPDGRLRTSLVWSIAKNTNAGQELVREPTEEYEQIDQYLVKRAEIAKKAKRELTERLIGNVEIKFIEESECSSTVDLFLMNPIVPWEQKDLVMAGLHGEKRLVHALAIFASNLVFLASWGIESRKKEESFHDDPVLSLVADGLDPTHPCFVHVLAGNVLTNQDVVREWQARLVDMRCLYLCMVFFAIRRAHDVGHESSDEFMPLDAIVSLVPRIALNHPEWAIAHAFSLIAENGDEIADRVVSRMSEFEADDLAPCLKIVFKHAAKNDLASVVRDRLDRAGLTERWLPMREALHAVSIGSREALDALAPEVRDAAILLYDQWVG